MTMTTMTAPPVRISGDLKRRINQMAHSMAAKYEDLQRAALTERLRTLAEQGKRHSELHDALNELER